MIGTQNSSFHNYFPMFHCYLYAWVYFFCYIHVVAIPYNGCYSASLPSPISNDVTWVARNHPQWDCFHHGNGQMYKFRNLIYCSLKLCVFVCLGWLLHYFNFALWSLEYLSYILYWNITSFIRRSFLICMRVLSPQALELFHAYRRRPCPVCSGCHNRTP